MLGRYHSYNNSVSNHQKRIGQFERRQNRGYLLPTLFLGLEVLISYLLLYIGHGGGDFMQWNPIAVFAVVFFFLASCVRRYIKVIKRTSLIRHRRLNRYKGAGLA